MIEKYKKVKELYDKGLSYNEIGAKLNMCKSTVAYYLNRFDNEEYIKKASLKEKQNLEYESIVCETYKQFNSLTKTCVMLNKRPTQTTFEYIRRILEKNNIPIDNTVKERVSKPHQDLTEVDIFSKNSKLSSLSHLKKYILKFNLKEERCEKCGNTHWNGIKISLEVHHIDGDRGNNEINNLQLLCPNCHSQTDNYCGKKKKKSEDIPRVTTQTKYIKNNIPNKETLIHAFKKKGSFKGVGEVYNVSDNAVKKWFIKHNLPSTAKAVRDMIIEMYGKQPQWYSYMEGRDLSKSIEKRGCKIEVYSKNGEYLTTCRSILEASRFTNISKNTLAKYLKGEEIKCKEFIFKKI